MTHTLRFVLAAGLVAVTLSGCGWFYNKKTPLVGERVGDGDPATFHGQLR